MGGDLDPALLADSVSGRCEVAAQPGDPTV
jgi:hypothetical protein